MKIVAVSDLHGHLPEIPQCDLLLIAGDICPATDHHVLYQTKWVLGPFNDWLRSLPVKHKAVVAGNHDFVFQHVPEIHKEVAAHYLQDSGCVINDFLIWGTPWQPPFFDWAFNAPEEELQKKWALIPDGTDILVTHAPPHGFLDHVGGKHVGSTTLKKRIEFMRELKLHVFGHIHCAYGRRRWGGLELVNAAYVDNCFYIPKNAPVVIYLG